jgi:hypothetical protein
MTASSADGRYALPGLPASRYIVEFSAGCGATGYATQWWKDATSAADATAVSVRVGGTASAVNALLAP